MTIMKEPEFQIYQCVNPDCRFRCPNDLTARKMERCPVCGAEFVAQGNPFSNYQCTPGILAAGKPQIEVVLDNLRSTLNVGSIFRTADGAGVRNIYCCGTTPTPRHPKIEKTSLGAEGFIPWTLCRNVLDLVEEEKQPGTLVVSLESTDKSIPINAFSIPKDTLKILLLVGNEVSGIDPSILLLSDVHLSIPMYGKKSSLNVAVAFGIAVYALIK